MHRWRSETDEKETVANGESHFSPGRSHFRTKLLLVCKVFASVFEMEVKSSNDGLLTNIEVLEIIKESRQKRGKATPEFHHREFVEVETINYISKSKLKSIPMEHIRLCLSAVKKLNFGLTEGEMIQIANLGPESDVEYYLVSNS